ncbi:MAG TPA: DUF2911 domain-containing protein [Gemmatimonadaceae bacterium]|nr:DUF2911 domain-containing protein [Gemmatimonadaceae bacterium]
MRHSLRALAFVTSALPLTLAAQQPAQSPPLRVAASSFATVEVHLNARWIGREWFEEDASLTGPSRIAISYGQPHARGRRIEGGLIPRDSVWRFGANQSTTLHTDVDLLLDSLRLRRGDYALYLQRTPSAWQLIVNRGTGRWGTDYDPADDVGRVVLAARTRVESEESLTIYLVPDSPRPGSGYADLRGRLRIVWGTTELSTGWRIVP